VARLGVGVVAVSDLGTELGDSLREYRSEDSVSESD
jgi:hypothetical protein